MKIHIIGGSGSGKTYLANRLSQEYKVEHYDLEDLQWDNKADSYSENDMMEIKKLIEPYENKVTGI